MYKLILYFTITLFCYVLNAQEIIPLYSIDGVPNQSQVEVNDSIVNDRYRQIEMPRIAVYRTSDDENKAAAVLIIPGGGYHHVTHNMSGIQLAKWFNTMGITAFVLYYRLPNQTNLVEHKIVPLQDAQRAMQIIRANVKKWGVNPDKIGVMGTSAGGHLAALLATQKGDIIGLQDSISDYPSKVNFTILVSPVISMNKEISHAGSCINLLGEHPAKEIVEQYSCQNRVTSTTPPTILFHANDDNAVPPINSVMFYEALLKNNINASLHIFSYGKHNIALRNNPGSTQYWVNLCEEWLKEINVLK